MVTENTDACAKERAEQVKKNADAYNYMVNLDGTVGAGADQAALLQHFMGNGSQHPDRAKQAADILLRCPPLPANGRLKKKIWYDEDDGITTDPDRVCRVVEVGLKGDDDSCPTSHIGQDVVDIALKANLALAGIETSALIPELDADDPECYELLATSVEEVEWLLPPEYHPGWGQLSLIEQCLTDPIFTAGLSRASSLADQVEFNEEGCGLPNKMPSIMRPVLSWVRKDPCCCKGDDCYLERISPGFPEQWLPANFPPTGTPEPQLFWVVPFTPITNTSDCKMCLDITVQGSSFRIQNPDGTSGRIWVQAGVPLFRSDGTRVFDASWQDSTRDFGNFSSRYCVELLPGQSHTPRAEFLIQYTDNSAPGALVHDSGVSPQWTTTVKKSYSPLEEKC